MSIVSCARACRALLFAATVLLAQLTILLMPLSASPLELHKLVASFRPEPFGATTRTVVRGGLFDKWSGVQAKLDAEQHTITACRDDRAHCTNKAAILFLAIVDAARAREGLARFGEINRAINLAIRPMSDLANYGEVDVWSAPLTTLERGAGDCEDYAIAKMAALKAAGVPSDDLRLVILHDTARGEDHAVLAARLDERWLVLDNRMLVMRADKEITDYRPIFVADDGGVRAYRTDVEPQVRPDVHQVNAQDAAYLISAQAGAAS